MEMAAVMDEIGDALDTIDGLRVYRHPTGSASPPCAVVSFPLEWTYDLSMRRGADRCSLPVIVAVGNVTDRTAPERLGKYLDGDGDQSVKAVVEAHEPTSFDTARVQGAEIDVITIGGVELLAATFTIDIAGEGA